MTKGIISLMTLCAGFLVVSCGTGKNSAYSVPVVGEWNIVEVDGKTLNAAGGSQPTIGFDAVNRRIYGNSGCNRMMGTYETHSSKPGSLSFGPIGSTRMACPDMSVENRILAALKEVVSYTKVTGRKSKGDAPAELALCDQKGKPLMILQRILLDRSALNGEWKIADLKGAEAGTTEKEPFIGFDVKENRIYGNAGCNNFNGAFGQSGKQPNSLDFGQVVSTMMACPDLSTEDAILSALNQVKSFEFQGKDQVKLLDGEGNQLLGLIRK